MKIMNYIKHFWVNKMNDELNEEFRHIKEIIQKAAGLYKMYFPAFILLGIFLGFANEIGQTIAVFLKDQTQATTLLTGLLLSSAVTMAAIHFSAGIYQGEDIGLKTAFARIGQKYLSFVSVTIVSAIAILFGFFLFIIPGIYLAVVLCFADVILVLRPEVIGFDSLKESALLVQGVFRRVLICQFFIVALIIVPFGLAKGLVILNPSLSKLIIVLTTVFIIPFTNLTKVALYYAISDLKKQLENEEII
jgi:hypothetical protein